MNQSTRESIIIWLWAIALTAMGYAGARVLGALGLL